MEVTKDSPTADREPCTHELKVWSEFFPSLCDGSKPFDVRKNDRDYRVGDSLYLNEILKESGEYTSGQTLKVITYVLPGPAFGIAEGYAVLGLADQPPDAFCRALAHETNEARCKDSDGCPYPDDRCKDVCYQSVHYQPANTKPAETVRRRHFENNGINLSLCITCGQHYDWHERNIDGNWCPVNTTESQS